MAKKKTPTRKTSVATKGGKKPAAKAGKPAPAPKAASEKRPAARSRPGIAPLEPDFPIAAIGASAGGLEAFRSLLGALPADAKPAFVIIQHLSPNHESILPELLSRFSPLPVMEAHDGIAVAAGTIYVMPPNRTMTLEHARLRLHERSGSGRHMPIDVFLRSLSKDQPHRAIAIILSGAGSDGTLGLQEVKEVGGITFAQDEKSAKFDSMPRSAISTGSVDFVMPPEKIAAELGHICRLARHRTRPGETEAPSLDGNHIGTIFSLLRRHSGVDFSQYKQTTIKRRILRRMILQRLESLTDYLEALRKNPAEVQALYQDILIKVTNFFRDPESFEALKKTVFPSILKGRSADTSVRIWVPGCSTGEEVYSLAIALLECIGDMAANTPIQIFATDISDEALARARSGVYVENISLDVSPERLRRFFVRVESHYQISKQIRDMCIFARHDVTQDHPFSRIDLISCRNLLIYLDLPLQKKVFPTFHYALKPDGHLMLGTSETVGSFTDLFTLADKKSKIYRKKVAPLRFHLPVGGSIQVPDRMEPVKRNADQAWPGSEVQKEADRLVLSSYAPPGVVVNSDMDIIQFRGQTGPYLEPAPGAASLNFLKMLLPPLLLNARRTIDAVKKTRAASRSEWVHFSHDGKSRSVSIEAVPLPSSSGNLESYFLMLFREQQPPAESRPAAAKGRKKEADQAADLRKELVAAKEYLQTIIEEQEASNEELKSANEEILSSNEELQSINEELETAKEELQSTNEELTTLNEELQNRNLELNQVNNDMLNLLTSVNVPIVMLGNDLRIRRFTPMAEKVLRIIATDVGRPFADIKTFSSLRNVEQDILEVIDSMAVREMEIQDDKGHWYSLRIRPYRTTENKIDGVVLVFIDIDILKTGIVLLQEANGYAEAIVQTVPHPMVVLDQEGRVKTANRAYLELFDDAVFEVTGRSIMDLGFRKTPIPRLREMLTEDGLWSRSIRDVEAETGNGADARILRLNSGIVRSEQGKSHFLLLSMEDITDRRRAESEVNRLNGELEVRVSELTGVNERLNREALERHRAEENLRSTVAELESFSYSVSHDLRAPLRAMQGVAEALEEDYRERLDDTGRDYTRRIVSAAHRMDALILDLLNYSRLGKSDKDLQACSLDHATASVISQLEKEIRETQAQVIVRSPLGEVMANRTLLEKALLNLVSNGLKFTPPDTAPRVEVRAETRDGSVRVWVEDNGIGIEPEQHERIFKLFERLNGMEKYPGTGIGLAIVRKSIENQGGKVGVESLPGQGSRFWFELAGVAP